MTAIPPGQAAAAGGMVNMARGLGTALGVAVVTLALHAAARLGHAPLAGGGHGSAGRVRPGSGVGRRAASAPADNGRTARRRRARPSQVSR